MAIQPINLGTYANDGTGDDLRSAFQKVNANILELASTVYGANVGAVPPTSGVYEGELWWSTVEGRMYIKYGTTWVDASPADGFVEYDISAVATTGGVNVRLSGTDLSQDDIKIAAGANILVTRTDANTITLSAPSFTGNVTGNLTGNSAGIHTGSVIGDTTGFHTGSVTGDVTGNLTGYVNGNVTGNVTGNLTGDSFGIHTGSVVGNVNGSVTGNAGSVTNGVYTTSSINALVDVNTVSTPPTSGQALVWNGTNWVPGTVATSGGGLDFGTFSAPAGFILDFGTF
jgi:hypothetical protein